MLEAQTVQHRGFRNIEKDGKVIGFQVCVRQQGYLGVWLSELRPGAVIVDGVEYKGDQVTWNISGVDYTEEEMLKLGRVKWPLKEVAVLKIMKEGGLSQGEHEVSTTFGHIASYIPPRMDEMAGKPNPFHQEEPRKLIIV